MLAGTLSGQPEPPRKGPATAKGRYDTSAPPTVNDDETLGYAENSVWYTASPIKLWKCVAPTTGAAVWREIPIVPGANLGTDPGADRLTFWDDSASELTWLTPGTGLSISGTTLNAALGLTIGTTTIASGTNNRVLYQASGVVSQSASLTFDGTKLNVGGGSSTTSLEVTRSDNTNYAVVIENSGGVGRVLRLKSGGSSGQKVFLVEVAGSEIFSLQAGSGPTLSMSTADNTYYTTSITNSGGSGKMLYLQTGGFSAQGVFQVNSGATNIFRVNSSGSPGYFDCDAADNTNFIGYLRNTGGSGRVLKLVSASSSSSIPLIEALGSTSTTVFSLFADGSVSLLGGLTPASMADSSAANGTIYYSTTAGKLVYKNSAGTVNNLY